jgi:hypothetical protein
MQTYTVYFELYGKKMKTDIVASSQAEAMQMIRDKVIFHKVQPRDYFSDICDILNIKV